MLRMSDRFVLPVIGVVSLGVVVVVGLLLLGREESGDGRLDVSALPALNAFLNGLSALFLSAGYLFIRRKKPTAHKLSMLTAFFVSTLFLVSYLVYHYHAGAKPFGGTGAIRVVYFSLLVSHIVLAAVIVPLTLTTIYRAWRGEFNLHKRIARFTLPIWLYVSVTGVVVYWMLYRLSPR